MSWVTMTWSARLLQAPEVSLAPGGALARAPLGGAPPPPPGTPAGVALLPDGGTLLVALATVVARAAGWVGGQGGEVHLVGGTQAPVWSRTLPSSHTQAGVHPPPCTCTSRRCRVEQVAWRECRWRGAPRVAGRGTGSRGWRRHTWAPHPPPPSPAGRTTWPPRRCTPAQLHEEKSTTYDHQLGWHSPPWCLA